MSDQTQVEEVQEVPDEVSDEASEAEPNFTDVEVPSTEQRTALIKAYIHACAACLPEGVELDFELLIEMFIFDSKLARAEIMEKAQTAQAKKEKGDG